MGAPRKRRQTRPPGEDAAARQQRKCLSLPHLFPLHASLVFISVRDSIEPAFQHHHRDPDPSATDLVSVSQRGERDDWTSFTETYKQPPPHPQILSRSHWLHFRCFSVLLGCGLLKTEQSCVTFVSFNEGFFFVFFFP